MKLVDYEFQIIGLGSVTPIGGCVATQYASVHAQLSRFQLLERDEQPALHVARIGELPAERLERIQRLLMGALTQCTRSTLSREAEVPLWLALPADIEARHLVARGARFGLFHVGEVVQIAERARERAARAPARGREPASWTKRAGVCGRRGRRQRR